jgi:tRNA (guanine-N7-)-methyltransferase
MLHCATDWEPYAEAMREVLDAEPSLHDPYDGWAPRLARPLTKFERQGVEKGHVVRDLVRTRV